MRHARQDYQDAIIDTRTEGGIPEDEPVFLLRGQDQEAPEAVRLWALSAEESGADEAIVEAARDQADAMEKWQRRHGAKIPDMPEGAAGV